jgi:hypothetical protein
LKENISLVESLLVSFFLGLVAMAILSFRYLEIQNYSWSDGLWLGLTYCACSYVYFHFLNIGQSSVRIRILTEIEMAQGLTTKSDLQKRYGGKRILDLRLGRLLANGQVTQKDQRFFLGKPRLIFIAYFFQLLKKIVFGIKSV